MKYLDIEFDYQNKPSLEPEYIPFGVWADAYLSEAARPFRVAVERDQGNVSVFSSFLRDETYEKANYRYMERYVKFLLWSVGGWKVTICGCEETAEKLQKAYVRGGDRDFDAGFFDDVFEHFQSPMKTRVPWDAIWMGAGSDLTPAAPIVKCRLS